MGDPSPARVLPVCDPSRQVERFLSTFKFVFPLKVFLLNRLIVFYGQKERESQALARVLCVSNGNGIRVKVPSSLPTITL